MEKPKKGQLRRCKNRRNYNIKEIFIKYYGIVDWICLPQEGTGGVLLRKRR